MNLTKTGAIIGISVSVASGVAYVACLFLDNKRSKEKHVKEMELMADLKSRRDLEDFLENNKKKVNPKSPK